MASAGMRRLLMLATFAITVAITHCLRMSKARFYSESINANMFMEKSRARMLTDNIEESLEGLEYGLHLYSNAPLNKEGIITSGMTVFVTCVFKLNRKKICQMYEECPEMRFAWNLPKWLREEAIDKSDIRVYINDDPVKHLAKPDDEAYISTLAIEKAGGMHNGLWSASFKFFDKDNGKLDRKEVTFQLNVDGIVEGQSCVYDDHCYSSTCYKDSLLCNLFCSSA